MTRTKLRDRILPSYTLGEELISSVSHALGAIFGIIALILCTLKAQGAIAVTSSVIYCASLIILYTMSAVYHALPKGMGKQVMRVLDHCTIYFLIAGTYTPITLQSIRRVSEWWGWAIFGLVWGLAAMATVFTAIDLKKYSKLSMACYIGMGWCVILAIKPTLRSMAPAGLLLLLSGGIAYTVGAVFYGIGKKHRYIHAVFHVFVLLGSLLQFLCIYCYVL